ncbi:ATP-binding Cassette (ABC) Superfamily, partial [Thraustotheca clavata]
MAQTTSTGSFYDARLEKEQQLHVRMLLGSDRALNQSCLRRLAILDNVVLFKLLQIVIFADFFLNLGTTAISSQYTFYEVEDYTRLVSTACIGLCALELFVRVVLLGRLMWSSAAARWDMFAFVLMAALLGCRYWKKDNRNNWHITINGKEKDQFHDKYKINQIELYFAAAYCFAAALRFVLKSQAREDSLKFQNPAKETTVSIASLRSTLRSIPGMTQEAISLMETDLSILCGDSDGMITTGELQAFLEKAVAFRPAAMSIAEFLQHLHCLNTTPATAYGIQQVLGSTYRHWSNQKVLLTATFFIVLAHATLVPIMAYLLQILGDYAFPTSAMTFLQTGEGKKPELVHQIFYPNKVLADNKTYITIPSIKPHNSLLVGIIGLAAICIPYVILDGLMGYCQSRLLSSATERMQSNLLSILLHEKTSFYAQRSEGDLNNLFASDIARVNTLWQAVFWNFIYPVVSITLGFSALMFFDPTVGMMSFGFALISIMSGPRTFASKQSQTFGSKSAYAAAEFQNAVSCHKVIRAYRIQTPLLSKFTGTIDSLRDAQFKNDFWSGMVQIYVESAMFLFVAIMTCGMAVKVWGGYMTAGDFFSVVTLLSRVSTPVTVLGGLYASIGNAASLQRLDTILDQ